MKNYIQENTGEIVKEEGPVEYDPDKKDWKHEYHGDNTQEGLRDYLLHALDDEPISNGNHVVMWIDERLKELEERLTIEEAEEAFHRWLHGGTLPKLHKICNCNSEKRKEFKEYLKEDSEDNISLTAQLNSLTKELNDCRKELDAIIFEKEALDKFYKVTVAERDYERVRSNRIERQRDAKYSIEEIEEVVKSLKIKGILAKGWENEEVLNIIFKDVLKALNSKRTEKEG